MNDVNVLIKNSLKKHGKYQYWLADILGITEWTLCRWMRKELPIERQREIVDLIEENTNAIDNPKPIQR